MHELFGEPRIRIRKIGILVYDGMFLMDAIGPMTVLSELMEANVYYIGLKKENVKIGYTEFVVKKNINDVKKLDILIIPGGSVDKWKISQDSAVLNWIKKIDSTTEITASVCSGAWILGEAGQVQY
ncbi:MAG: DJ-1/PfpI family protein [Flavobacteriales bacterium]